MKDNLTGLFNKNQFFKCIDELLKSCSNHSSVIYFDLDNFKDINHTLGYDIGDTFLSEIGNRLSSINIHSAKSFRISGDEFAILLPNLHKNKKRAKTISLNVAEKIKSIISLPISHSETHSIINASIGIYLFNKKTTTNSVDVLKYANESLYYAKTSGKNTIHILTSKLKEKTDQRLTLSKKLSKALHSNQFSIALQSQHDVTGKLRGAETLIRWDNQISPEVFIPHAEDTGIIIDIGNFTLDEACLFLDDTPKLKTLSVNLSPIQIHSNNFINIITEITNDHGIDPSRIEFEITENTLIKNMDECAATIKKCVDLGFSFCIDDFGTGFSCFNYLKVLPIKKIKIDKSFVSNIETNVIDRGIVEAMLLLANNMNLDTVAEGVETKEQLIILDSMGCNLYQGYYFSKPINASSFKTKFT